MNDPKSHHQSFHNVSRVVIRLQLMIAFSGMVTKVVAQTDSSSVTSKNVIIRDSVINAPHPKYEVKLGRLTIIPDTISLRQLNPEWIDKVVVLKDKEYKGFYDPPNDKGTIVIYIKRGFIDEAKKTLRIE